MRKILVCVYIGFVASSCNMPFSFDNRNETGRADSIAVSVDSSAAYDSSSVKVDSVMVKDSVKKDNTQQKDTVSAIVGTSVDTKNANPKELVAFAETLIGTPYRYGSTDPKVGFDCSGFITYVFHHFGISVPRSSIDFTSVGKEIPVKSAKPGDLILFTGTDSTERFVGHMGIVYSNSDTLNFIHSTSGKKYGVTITPLNKYYMGRFVKTIRLFKQNDG
jgi:cell wall-associated NlpC family hydrolase